MKIILGIGNPGRQYEGTRHNIGWAVLDELARRHNLGPWQRKWQSEVSAWRLADGDQALLLKPQTYVNLSGEAAQAALAFHKAPNQSA